MGCREIIMNVKLIFEACDDIIPFDEDCIKLLDKIMSITSPMKFDDRFATDEELDRLESELDRFNKRSPESNMLRQVVENLDPQKTSKFIFI